MGGLQPSADDLFRRKVSFEPGNVFLRPSNDRHPGTVGDRNRQVLTQQCRQLAFRHRYGEHGAGVELVDELRAFRHQTQSVLQRQCSSNCRRGELADAVADERFRHDAPAHQKPGQAVLHSEHRGLRQACPVQAIGIGILRLRATEEQPLQIRRLVFPIRPSIEQYFFEVDARFLAQIVEALVHRRTEDRLPQVQLRAHVHVLFPQSWEHERDR